MTPGTKLVVKIGGRKWRLLWVKHKEISRDADADCDHPPGRHPTIRIRAALGDKAMLNRVIHESTHASRPELSEEAVTALADDIERVLWRCGYRLLPSTPKENRSA